MNNSEANPKIQIPNPKSQGRVSRVRALGFRTWVLVFRTWVLGVGIWLLGFTLVSAQSLGDVAKREEARRKQVTTPAKVYTNDDLRGDTSAPAPAPPAAQTPPPSGTPPAAPAADAQSKGTDKAAADDAKKTEGYWKDRLAKARGDLDRAKTFAEALQSRINALTTDFAARSDPAQRAQIGNDRQKALAELDRVKKEIEANTKAISDIQDEGRKAGVPAGWVR
jgi:hypothetical protein